jgi:predicted dehydrogenase
MDYIAGSGGFFADVTVHDLDTARWMIGEIEEVTAVGAALSDPGTRSSGTSTTWWSRSASRAARSESSTTAARRGTATSARPRWWARKRGSASTATRRVYNQWLTPGQASVDRLDDFRELFPEAYLLELEDFAAAIRDDHPPSVTGVDGLAAFVLARACDRSRREGRTIRVRDEEPETEVGP